MKPPIVTLLTDFGSSDHYVGAMKGAILSICPDAQLVDITHEIEPYDITGAAFTLAQTWPYFPKGTVHLIVVDPGVGGTRRALIAEAAGHFFVAPDNGVLSLISPELSAREITEERFFRKPVSRTFHGRDIFGPVAAHLAMGRESAEFGKAIADPVMLAISKPVEKDHGAWEGVVLRVDRFGNLITNFRSDFFVEDPFGHFEIRVGRGVIVRLANSYGDATDSEPFAIVGSSGYLEVSVNKGDAASVLNCSGGSNVHIRKC
jgi:S-adenosylmethionine hydrolase